MKLHKPKCELTIPRFSTVTIFAKSKFDSNFTVIKLQDNTSLQKTLSSQIKQKHIQAFY